jgi:hypothetical protein
MSTDLKLCRGYKVINRKIKRDPKSNPHILQQNYTFTVIKEHSSLQRMLRINRTVIVRSIWLDYARERVECKRQAFRTQKCGCHPHGKAPIKDSWRWKHIIQVASVVVCRNGKLKSTSWSPVLGADLTLFWTFIWAPATRRLTLDRRGTIPKAMWRM